MTQEATSGFRTVLAAFTGPLDLLLYLIRKNEIDILDIPIAEILAQYQEYTGLLKDLDVNLAGDYLVMAATLMEIKSRMLLPQADLEGEEETAEDPRDNLVRQLLEYREHKERALSLGNRLQENARRYRRLSGSEDLALDSIELGKVSVWDIVTAFLRIQKAVAADRPGDLVYTERPLTFYMELIQDTFDRAGADLVPFEDIFLARGPVDRYILVGIFLAVLELVKLGALGVDRGTSEGEFMVRRRMRDLTGSMEALAAHAGVAEGAGEENPAEGAGEEDSAEGAGEEDSAERAGEEDTAEVGGREEPAVVAPGEEPAEGAGAEEPAERAAEVPGIPADSEVREQS
jgi:segregation and condensation protein A